MMHFLAWVPFGGMNLTLLTDGLEIGDDTAQSSFEPTKTKGMILRNLAKTLKIPQYPSNIPPPRQGVLRDLRNR